MAIVEFIGLGPKYRYNKGTLPYAIDRMIKHGGDYSHVLDDIGRQSVMRTTQKIVDNKVTPPTTEETFDRRRTRKRRKNTKRTTLLDNGIGYLQVTHRVDSDSVAVGVPDGYMAYHEQGRVPNAPRRRFLMMLTKGEVLKIVNYHWQKVMG